MSPWWLKPPADDESEESPQKDEPQNEKDGEPAGGQSDLDLDPSTILMAALPEASEKAEKPAKRARPARPRRAKTEVREPESAEEPAAEKTARTSASGGRPSRRRGGRSKAASKGDAKSAETAGDQAGDQEGGQTGGKSRPAPKAAAKSAAKPKSRARPRKKAAARDAVLEDADEFASPVYVAVSESGRPLIDERRMALFCDLENIALGVRDSDIKKFELNLVLERLVEKGKIIVKRAYADWERYKEFKRSFHEAGVELIDIPQKHYSGKNSADIKMVVDAMELCWAKEHLDTFVLLSGDSDFTPLVGKLKENNKHVIGIGVKNSSSRLLIDNCDEFIFYEDVWRDNQKGPALVGLNQKSAEVFRLLVDSIKALMRENKDVLWGSMVKQTMQRKRPSFNEGYYGYSSFSELLEDAEKQGILELKRDRRSGSYIITAL